MRLRNGQNHIHIFVHATGEFVDLPLVMAMPTSVGASRLIASGKLIEAKRSCLYEGLGDTEYKLIALSVRFP